MPNNSLNWPTGRAPAQGLATPPAASYFSRYPFGFAEPVRLGL
jgi:hypothetical protein